MKRYVMYTEDGRRCSTLIEACQETYLKRHGCLDGKVLMYFHAKTWEEAKKKMSDVNGYT